MWLGHPQGSVHMTAARLSCKSNMVGTGWANSHPGCVSRLRKCNSRPVHFWQAKTVMVFGLIHNTRNEVSQK